MTYDPFYKQLEVKANRTSFLCEILTDITTRNYLIEGHNDKLG